MNTHISGAVVLLIILSACKGPDAPPLATFHPSLECGRLTLRDGQGKERFVLDAEQGIEMLDDSRQVLFRVKSLVVDGQRDTRIELGYLGQRGGLQWPAEITLAVVNGIPVLTLLDKKLNDVPAPGDSMAVRITVAQGLETIK